jgi:hypothetical protein
MNLEELLRLKEENYDLFLETVKNLNQEYSRYSDFSNGRLSTMTGTSFALKGKEKSEEQRKKLSESKKGKPTSEDHKKKISEGLLKSENHPWKGGFSEEHRKNISQSKIGISPSKETRQKLSVAGKGNKLSKESLDKIVQTRTNRAFAIYQGKTFSLTDLSLELNLPKQVISNIKSGKRKNTFGIDFI